MVTTAMIVLLVVGIVAFLVELRKTKARKAVRLRAQLSRNSDRVTIPLLPDPLTETSAQRYGQLRAMKVHDAEAETDTLLTETVLRAWREAEALSVGGTDASPYMDHSTVTQHHTPHGYSHSSHDSFDGGHSGGGGGGASWGDSNALDSSTSSDSGGSSGGSSDSGSSDSGGGGDSGGGSD